MVIIMGRILAQEDDKVLIEPYGTYEDWYDLPNEDMRRWIPKSAIETINDEYVGSYDHHINTEDALEIAMATSSARRLL